MSKAYIVAQVAVSDPERYEGYKALATVAVAQYGGKYIVRGGETQRLEGDWTPSRLVVLEFDSVAAAQRFYNSPEYGAARRQREGAARMDMLIAEGL
ncbi:MAG: DUF1330 domain-containing protein [Zoogloeaceae bacterium]|jgi:uncharacterized protein (DUF1330 family)|nr:DUF1330 domain-containing protein [Zoogloeaceae bacterium]